NLNSYFNNSNAFLNFNKPSSKQQQQLQQAQQDPSHAYITPPASPILSPIKTGDYLENVPTLYLSNDPNSSQFDLTSTKNDFMYQNNFINNTNTSINLKNNFISQTSNSNLQNFNLNNNLVNSRNNHIYNQEHQSRNTNPVTQIHHYNNNRSEFIQPPQNINIKLNDYQSYSPQHHQHHHLQQFPSVNNSSHQIPSHTSQLHFQQQNRPNHTVSEHQRLYHPQPTKNNVITDRQLYVSTPIMENNINNVQRQFPSQGLQSVGNNHLADQSHNHPSQGLLVHNTNVNLVGQYSTQLMPNFEDPSKQLQYQYQLPSQSSNTNNTSFILPNHGQSQPPILKSPEQLNTHNTDPEQVLKKSFTQGASNNIKLKKFSGDPGFNSVTRNEKAIESNIIIVKPKTDTHGSISKVAGEKEKVLKTVNRPFQCAQCLLTFARKHDLTR
ncbi:hypothetical protein HK099_000174, partial [Clydaea vesicula]